jgi:hypothetical protein
MIDWIQAGQTTINLITVWYLTQMSEIGIDEVIRQACQLNGKIIPDRGSKDPRSVSSQRELIG